MSAVPEIDSDALKLFSFQLFTKLEGAVTAGMVHLGDQLGLYSVLAAADGPLTTHELAERAGLHERWVREWAHNQAAAKFITIADGGRFGITPEAAAVMATPDHPAYGMGMFHRLPQTMRALDDVRDSFRTGIGHDYDSHGPQGAVGIERSFEPWSNANLLPVVLPAIDGLVERLQAGAAVADIGCGAGSAVILMAAAFPQSYFRGYDISQYALARAALKLEESGLHNADFHDPRHEPLPTDQSLDFITTFDCIHDMTRPTEMMKAIRRAIKPDGMWLLVDIKALDTFEENARKNPMAPLMYGISVLSCMSSALSEEGGEGLGTLGFSESTARAMTAEAGFTRFDKLPVDHSVNAFYLVRP
ncbi:MAG: class I SAM-dependent methyltransferase [Actinomycetota bacterium]|nr:class I SAM-dependent methyltransferase [Actinomycetota bacterium]